MVRPRRDPSAVVGFVGKSAELDRRYLTKELTRTEYLRRRRILAANTAEWVSSLISSQGARELVVDYLEHKSNQSLVASALSQSIGQQSEGLMRSLSWLQTHFNMLPRTISYEDLRRDVQRFENESSRLDQALRLGELSLVDFRHTKQALRKRVTAWLGGKIPYLDGLSVARKFIYEAREKERVAALRHGTHPEPAEAWLLPLDNLRQKLFVESFISAERSHLFPFKFKKKNMVRGFVPHGYVAIDTDKAARQAAEDLVSLLSRRTSLNDIEILSVFTEYGSQRVNGPVTDTVSMVTGRNVFVVFRDRQAAINGSGIAYFSNGVLAHVKVFQSRHRKRKSAD